MNDEYVEYQQGKNPKIKRMPIADYNLLKNDKMLETPKNKILEDIKGQKPIAETPQEHTAEEKPIEGQTVIDGVS